MGEVLNRENEMVQEIEELVLTKVLIERNELNEMEMCDIENIITISEDGKTVDFKMVIGSTEGDIEKFIVPKLELEGKELNFVLVIRGVVRELVVEHRELEVKLLSSGKVLDIIERELDKVEFI